MLSKKKMAHDFAIMRMKKATIEDYLDGVALAWEYADAMQAEEDKRKEIETNALLKVQAEAYMNCELGVVDEKGEYKLTTRQKELDKNLWQPDWSQAPSDATAWEYLGYGSARWHTTKDGFFKEAPTFGRPYYGSMILRKRP